MNFSYTQKISAKYPASYEHSGINDELCCGTISKRYGKKKRIVFARELNIEEIKEIRKKVPGMEIEIFVHGSMCMTYSGRCHLGDYMSGRPGNKGECSHACRFKYKVRLEEERRPGKLF